MGPLCATFATFCEFLLQNKKSVLFCEHSWEATEAYMTSAQKNHVCQGHVKAKCDTMESWPYLEIFVAEKTIIPFQYESQVDLMIFKP